MSTGGQPPVTGKADALKDRPVLSVVTCLLDEEKIVPELVRRVTGGCRSLGFPSEFVVVNDGSSDGTLPSLIALSREIAELRIINPFRRFGHMSAPCLTGRNAPLRLTQ